MILIISTIGRTSEGKDCLFKKIYSKPSGHHKTTNKISNKLVNIVDDLVRCFTQELVETKSRAKRQHGILLN